MAAIYMWFDDEEVVIVTTTLYPVDVTEAIVFGVTISGGSMDLLPNNDIANSIAIFDGTNVQTRWFYNIDDGDQYIANSIAIFDGTNVQTRWFYEVDDGDQYIANSIAIFDGTVVNKLVEVDTTDEELQLTVRVSVTSTMDLI